MVMQPQCEASLCLKLLTFTLLALYEWLLVYSSGLQLDMHLKKRGHGHMWAPLWSTWLAEFGAEENITLDLA